MTAALQVNLVLFEPVGGSGFDREFMRVVSAMSLHVEVVDDETRCEEILSDLADGATCAVVVCAPLTEFGSANELLHRVRVIGSSAGFVGYGDFTKTALSQLVRLGADEVVGPPVVDGALAIAIEQASRRAARRMQQEQEHQATCDEILALKTALRNSGDRLRAARGVAIESLLIALEVREADATLHSLRVQAYASHLALLAGYPERARESLGQAALLHDIGKIGMSDEILFRNGWLTHQELRQLEPHAEFGARIVERIDFLRPLAPIVRHHHERFDGQGFPDHLVGNSIPLGARIFSIADSLDAMTSDKPYRAAMTFEVAAQEIQRSAGKQFDPAIVEQFLSVAPGKWRAIREQVMDEYRSRPALFLFPATLPLAHIA